MDKSFLPSYSSSQMTYVEVEEFLRFRFHIPDRNTIKTDGSCFHNYNNKPFSGKPILRCGTA